MIYIFRNTEYLLWTYNTGSYKLKCSTKWGVKHTSTCTFLGEEEMIISALQWWLSLHIHFSTCPYHDLQQCTACQLSIQCACSMYFTTCTELKPQARLVLFLHTCNAVQDVLFIAGNDNCCITGSYCTIEQEKQGSQQNKSLGKT